MKVHAFWRPGACPLVLRASAFAGPFTHPEDRLKLSDLPGERSILLTPDKRQHLLISDGGRSIQLVCEDGNLLDRDASLTFHIDGFRRGDRRVLTYRRLRSLRLTRRFEPPLFKSAPRWRQLRKALVALDGVLAGRRRREIGIRLFGENRVAEDWAEPNNRLKGQVRYAIEQGRELMNGGYRRLLM